MAVRRETIWFLARIELPDPIRAIGMPSIPAQDGSPEHETLHLLTACLLNAFIADFANEDRHAGACGERTINCLNGVGNAFAVTMARLQHVKIEDRWIVYAESRSAGRVNSNRMMMRIHGAHIRCQFGQPMLLRFGILLFGL